MSTKIAIVSGKGGTGKTSVSVNLFYFIEKYWTSNVQLADCDVEEPNASIFLNSLTSASTTDVNQNVPFINIDQCSFCRQCVEYCEFNAIVVIPPVQFAEINSSLCHSCEACIYACPNNAIINQPHKIGHITSYQKDGNTKLMEGSLMVGSPMQTMVIKSLISNDELNEEIILLDSPPGTSCPVVTTVDHSDYVIVVTEPTPFGFHDLKLMVNLLKKINKPFGVIINKANEHFSETDHYLKKEKIELLGQIPFNMEYARSYSKGQIMKDIPDEISGMYINLTNKLKSKLAEHA